MTSSCNLGFKILKTENFKKIFLFCEYCEKTRKGAVAQGCEFLGWCQEQHAARYVRVVH